MLGDNYIKEVTKMWRDSEQVLDSIFLSYNKILKRLDLLGITTKHGKEMTQMDLRKAIDVMLKNIQHVDSEARKLKVENILVEGYEWLKRVYFQKEKSLTDADVDFFETRISCMRIF